MSSALNLTVGKPTLRLQSLSNTGDQSTTQNPANAAASLASALPTLRELSLVPTPAQSGPSSPAEPFPLNSEIQNLEEDKNHIIEQRNFGMVMPLSAYHCADFRFNCPKNSTIYVLLGYLSNGNQPTNQPLNLNIPNNFENMVLVDHQGNCRPINNSFKQLTHEALNQKQPYNTTMSTSYSVLPKNLNQTDHADLIRAFTHSLCLSGVGYMATQAAQALKTHWPEMSVKNILDAGFRIPQHHPLLRHVFPNTKKITAVDCQHCPEINGSMVSIEQVQALLHKNDEYVINYAQKYGIPENTDLILIRNLEVHTAPGAWASFFEQAQTSTDWKALLVSCSSTVIFERRLKPLTDKHFKSDAFEIVHCGENPEAQRIHINYNRSEIKGSELIGKECKDTVGPDAFCAIIVRKNVEQKPTQHQNRQTQTGQPQPKLKPSAKSSNNSSGLRRGFFGQLPTAKTLARHHT